MKYHRLLIIVSILFVSGLTQASFAQEYEDPDMHLKIAMKHHGSGVERVGERLLFSYSSEEPTRRVGIAFQHENFREVHPFRRNAHGVFVLPYTPPASAGRIVYRLIVDGLWISDPRNPQTIDLAGGLECSVFQLPQQSPKKAEATRATSSEERRVTFRFQSPQDGYIAVAGNFNHWDPFMHNLSKQASSEDIYSLSLSLPPGTYYYYFVVNGQRVPDPHNPRIARTKEGKIVSVIEVQG